MKPFQRKDQYIGGQEDPRKTTLNKCTSLGDLMCTIQSCKELDEKEKPVKLTGTIMKADEVTSSGRVYSKAALQEAWKNAMKYDMKTSDSPYIAHVVDMYGYTEEETKTILKKRKGWLYRSLTALAFTPFWIFLTQTGIPTVDYPPFSCTGDFWGFIILLLVAWFCSERYVNMGKKVGRI